MRRIVGLFLVLLCIVGLTLGIFYWPKIERRVKKISIDKTQEAKDIERTKDLLNNSKPEEALALIQQYSEEIDPNTEYGKEWLDLLIRASEATSNISQLVVLHEYYPKAFDSHEKAALLVANYYLSTGRTKDFQVLRDNWKGRETLPETWFVLDGDKILVEGKRKEAIDFLTSRTFTGKADTPRLVRLALLYVFENPNIAWDYLKQAYAKDPENPEIRSYRAKLLETVGKNNLALTEYIAAAQTDPNNIYLKDQLAEFFRRNHQIPLALQVWSENLKEPSLDFIWLKTLFWNRIVTPVKFNWNSIPTPKGKLNPLIQYLLVLEPDEFWNSAKFNSVPQAQQFLKTQQSTFWLRLLALLKQGKEKEAYDLLQFNPFQTVSWNPQLEQALKKIILYRETGKLNPEETTQREIENKAGTQSVAKNLPAFYEQLQNFAQLEQTDPAFQMPSDVQSLLKGPEAFSAALLASGWYEAALGLHTLTVIPKSYPDWYAYEITKGLQSNRGISQALEFATLQNPTPTLNLLIGELLIASNNPDAAIDRLSSIAKEDTDLGQRAALLISQIEIERGQYLEAKNLVNSHPKLSESVTGQETLARIALLEGNKDLANQIYSSLEEKSAEAKSYLARKAFEERDWKRARELTEQLLLVYPTNSLLQENLRKVIEEQNKMKTPK